MRFTRAYPSCTVCSPTRASLLTGKHPGDAGLELYDLKEDPGERINISKTRPAVTNALHGKLLSWLGSHHARFPSVNLAYRSDLATP